VPVSRVLIRRRYAAIRREVSGGCVEVDVEQSDVVAAVVALASGDHFLTVVFEGDG
jgi:hypothetical protein